jgi:hypothetical protein
MSSTTSPTATYAVQRIQLGWSRHGVRAASSEGSAAGDDTPRIVPGRQAALSLVPDEDEVEEEDDEVDEPEDPLSDFFSPDEEEPVEEPADEPLSALLRLSVR